MLAPDGFLESAVAARNGAEVAKIARSELEGRVGKKDTQPAQREIG